MEILLQEMAALIALSSRVGFATIQLVVQVRNNSDCTHLSKLNAVMVRFLEPNNGEFVQLSFLTC